VWTVATPSAVLSDGKSTAINIDACIIRAAPL
jgi:hypothetical protein